MAVARLTGNRVAPGIGRERGGGLSPRSVRVWRAMTFAMLPAHGGSRRPGGPPRTLVRRCCFSNVLFCAAWGNVDAPAGRCWTIRLERPLHDREAPNAVADTVLWSGDRCRLNRGPSEGVGELGLATSAKPSLPDVGVFALLPFLG